MAQGEPQSPPLISIPIVHTGQRRAAGLFLLVLSLLCSGAALSLFPQGERMDLAWRLYLASLTCFVYAVYLLFARPPGERRGVPISGRVIGFALLVLCLAIAGRLYRLDEIPFGTWYDEADMSLKALAMMDDPASSPVFVSFPSMTYPYFWLVGQAFRWFGADTVSIRLVAAVFGIGSVVAAFFMGTELRSARFGLLAAFFLAISRWSLTFSRLGMATMSAPFFILVTLLFLFRAFRNHAALEYGAAGVTLGIGLGFHPAFRLFPIVVLLFLICWIVHQWTIDRPNPVCRARLALNLTVLAIGAGMAAAPVAQIMIRQPNLFWERPIKVSIFQNRDEPNLGKALLSNTVEHLLMFNYQGDRNGRHNLPGAPMLDPITGVLFVLGLGLALRRWRQMPEMLFIALFLTGLSAGIFSVDFEAPQAQRAVGAMPSVFYFAALAAEALWRSIEQTRLGRLGQRKKATFLLIAGGLVAISNAHTYFVRQANDAAVWEAHNAVETLVARQMNNLNPNTTDFYFSPMLHNHRVIRFLASDSREGELLLPTDPLPLREPGDSPVMLFLDREQSSIATRALHYYPNAKQTVSYDPAGFPVLYSVLVLPEDIRAIQGLRAHYWHGATADGPPLATRIESKIKSVWPTDAPVALPFVTQWEGVLYVPEYGEYELLFQSPGQATLWLDGEAKLFNTDRGEYRKRLALPQGNHDLHIEAAGGEGVLSLAWRSTADAPPNTVPRWAFYHAPIVASDGLLGSYYPGTERQSEPTLMRIDPVIDSYFHLIPLPRPYSVDWTGAIEIPRTGEYGFGLNVRGRAQLYVDGQLVVDAAEPSDYVQGTINLNAGRHPLYLHYHDYLDYSRLHLYWTPPGGERQIIPSRALVPYQ